MVGYSRSFFGPGCGGADGCALIQLAGVTADDLRTVGNTLGDELTSQGYRKPALSACGGTQYSQQRDFPLIHGQLRPKSLDNSSAVISTTKGRP